MLARCCNDDFCALAIDGMKIVFVRHPHTGQTGKVVNLIDTAYGVFHRAPIKHRTSDMFNVWWDTGFRTKIENAHLSTALNECGYQILPDEAAAAGDKYLGHGSESGAP
ncbi:MAG: hypothetical protein JWP25_826 [Bradyrhizobium sp.]|nr:hypothetical protein [Bradyrhizobium sp.]